MLQLTIRAVCPPHRWYSLHVWVSPVRCINTHSPTRPTNALLLQESAWLRGFGWEGKAVDSAACGVLPKQCQEVFAAVPSPSLFPSLGPRERACWFPLFGWRVTSSHGLLFVVTVTTNDTWPPTVQQLWSYDGYCLLACDDDDDDEEDCCLSQGGCLFCFGLWLLATIHYNLKLCLQLTIHLYCRFIICVIKCRG